MSVPHKRVNGWGREEWVGISLLSSVPYLLHPLPICDFDCDCDVRYVPESSTPRESLIIFRTLCYFRCFLT